MALAGALPVTAAEAVYGVPGARAMQLVIGARTVALAGAAPASLATQGDRWQLTLTVETATG